MYRSTKGLLFYGTPHLGSAADKKKRVKLLKAIATAAFIKMPKNIGTALEQHSDELSDLADDFRKIGLCTERQLTIYTYFEAMSTSKLTSVVSQRPLLRAIKFTVRLKLIIRSLIGLQQPLAMTKKASSQSRQTTRAWSDLKTNMMTSFEVCQETSEY